MTPVSVVVVDDHAVFREGVRALLARVDEIALVGEAGTTDEAITVVDDLRPDVVLMDLHLPGDGGIAATTQIVRTGTAGAVLVLTMHDDSSRVRRALQAGASGYLLKDAKAEAIVRAILAVRDGQVVLDAGVADVIVRRPPGQDRAFPTLTQREFEVLERIALGLPNDAIAARLGISVKTVQNTVSSVLLKIGARDRAHAVSMAKDAGL